MASSSSGMNFTAFRSLSRAMLRGFVRDRTALAFSILLPVLFLALFGSLYRNNVTPKLSVIEIGNVSLLSDAASQPGLSGVLTVTHNSDKKAAVREVRRGDADVAVQQLGNQLVVHYSIADPTTASIVQTVFSSIVEQADQARAGPRGSYQLLTKQVESTTLKPIQFLAPGLLAWAIASGATFGAAITLVNWRHNKLLRRLRLAPVSTGSVVLARVGVSLLVALVQLVVFLLIATTPYFGLKLTPGWWAAIPVLICGTLAFMSIGLLVGSFAKTQQAATAIANLIILPMAFLGGAFIPLDFAPNWLRDVSYVMPLRYLVTGMQDVMARGEGAGAALHPDRHPGRPDRGPDDHRGPGVPLGRGLGGCAGLGEHSALRGHPGPRWPGTAPARHRAQGSGSGKIARAGDTVRERPRACARGAEGATSPEPLRHQGPDGTGVSGVGAASVATEGETATGGSRPGGSQWTSRHGILGPHPPSRRTCSARSATTRSMS